MIRNTYVVGDIHASLNALGQVLDRADFDNEKDKLIFLGDYCDGWSQSAEVINFLIQLQKHSPHEHVFIKGNHDIWVRDWLSIGDRDYVWAYNGGESTMDSYIKMGKNLDLEHRMFFENLKNYYVDEENRLFVHAGVSGEENLENEEESTLCWSREFWKLQLTNVRPQISPCRHYKEVYIGHTPTINFQVEPDYPEYEHPSQTKVGFITVPMNRGKTWNMDTGCGWGGKLSIMNIDTKELFQSDNSDTLHPDERGRKG